ncbi:restriction endonuclease subunit S [Vibrio penaeicida]|uniref:Type I restriction-modification enzyme, S subunit n=1 Tax=Vibrio penaeicida TaxID=104609 RepID=A0AAV5NM90_9VIBR|nr:restriction endonuclease subunit S [Vibrio penaeicida]RTZ24939.1 restriction endonuclease subunit S [Vibrio penaeicida]GLQ71176.1 type I restriction-modification enzyme, S subunit [Vibrio penaeicida]
MVTDTKYPPSVKAGKPILGETPEGWARESLKKHLTLEQRKVKVLDEKEYDLVTVKRSRGGVVRREHLYGRQISVKSQFSLKQGDFLISKRQIVHGACGIVPAHLDGSIVSNEYSIFTAKDSFDLTYLRYLSETLYFQQTCFHSSIGVHIEKMIFKLDNWFKWDFNLPPLPEQRKIAQILSTWDRGIATTEKLIETSKQQKKALMQQLLTGKKRLVNPETGKVFERGWEHGFLGDLCTFKGGSAFKEVYQGQLSGDYPFIKVSDMNLPQNGKFILQANNWITDEVAKTIKAKAFNAGSVVFAKVGAALLLNRRRILVQPTIVDNNMMAATPKNICSTEFLYQLMLMIDFAKFVQDGAVPSINQSDLSRFKISYPHFEEQQKIASVLTAADKEIEILEAKLTHFKQEKKALMQQLLTGKRRVSLSS